MQTTEALLEERKHKIQTLRDMKEKRLAEGDRPYSADEKETISVLNDELAKLDKDIKVREEDDKITASIDKRVESLTTPQDIHIPRGEAGRVSTINRSIYPRTFRTSGSLRGFSNDREGHEAAYRTGKWLQAQFLGDDKARRWCDQNDIEHRIMVEGVITKGGALVPDEASQRIITLREQYGVFRKYGYVESMGSDTKDIARQTAGLTPYFVGEKTALTAVDSAWDVVKLVVQKLAILTRMSSELDEDAIVSMADRFVRDVALAFATKEDQCAVSGDGTATYGGITGIKTKLQDIDGAGTDSLGVCAATSTGNTFLTLDIGDFTECIALAPSYVFNGDPAWYCSQTCWGNAMLRLAVAQGGSTGAELTGGVQKSFLGYPVRITQAMPTTTATQNTEIMVLFGDISMAATLGDRRGIKITRSEERYFDTDEIALKATERFDYNVHDVGSATVAGPVLGIQGTA